MNKFCYKLWLQKYSELLKSLFSNDQLQGFGGSMGRAPEFDSQRPHGDSQLSVTPVPGTLNTTFSSLQATGMYICMQAKHPCT